MEGVEDRAAVVALATLLWEEGRDTLRQVHAIFTSYSLTRLLTPAELCAPLACQASRAPREQEEALWLPLCLRAALRLLPCSAEGPLALASPTPLALSPLSGSPFEQLR